MSEAWPWLAVAGLGVLHGLNPAAGWMFATARGLRAGSAAEARRALLPIALGHAASIACVVAAVVAGLPPLDRAWAGRLVGLALIAAALGCGLRHGSWSTSRGATPGRATDADRRTATATAPRRRSLRRDLGHVGLAFWAFLMSAVHGTGLMLVPAFMPLCLSGTPAREIVAAGSLGPALAAVGVHMGAMLLAAGAMATGFCHALSRLSAGAARLRWPGPWPAVLAAAGAWMLLWG